MVAGAARTVGQQLEPRQCGLRRGIALPAFAFQPAHGARPGHHVERRRREAIGGACAVTGPGRSRLDGRIAGHVTVARHAPIAHGDDDVALAAGQLRIAPLVYDGQAVIDGRGRRGGRQHGTGLPSLQVAQGFVQQFGQRRRRGIRAGTPGIAAPQAIDVSAHTAATTRILLQVHAIGAIPLHIGIVLRQEIGGRPTLPSHMGQRRAQHAAIDRAGAGRRRVQEAKDAHAHPAAMALDRAHGLVVLAIRHAQVVALRPFGGVAHAHAR